MRCRILKAIVWNFGILCMRCRHDTNQEMAMGRAGRRGSCHSPWTMDNDGDGYRSHLWWCAVNECSLWWTNVHYFMYCTGGKGRGIWDESVCCPLTPHRAHTNSRTWLHIQLNISSSPWDYRNNSTDVVFSVLVPCCHHVTSKYRISCMESYVCRNQIPHSGWLYLCNPSCIQKPHKIWKYSTHS